jgi:hypothetical protein
MKIILYIADHYKKGCPSNASPRAIGYGLTREQALADRIPWNNQAPWAGNKVRQEIVVDGGRCPDCLPFDIFYAEGEVADLLKAKLWASALVKYLAD